MILRYFIELTCTTTIQSGFTKLYIIKCKINQHEKKFEPYIIYEYINNLDIL